MTIAVRSLGSCLLAAAMTMASCNEQAHAQTRPYNPMRPLNQQAASMPTGMAPGRLMPDEDIAAGPMRPVSSNNSNGQWRSARRDAPPPMMVETVAEAMPNETLPPPAQLNVEPESIIVPGGAGPLPSEMPGEMPWDDGSVYQGDAGGCCGDQCGGPGCCDPCGIGAHGCFGLGWLWPRDLALTTGVQGFKGPVDLGQNGNFGFHYGFNMGGMLRPQCGIAYQFGAQAVHSNLSGDNVIMQSADDRMQYFLTTGMFHRACGPGLQGGAVLDILYDDYYVNMRLSQVRGELSYVGPFGRELGVKVAVSTRDDLESTFEGALIDVGPLTEVWESTDQYALFYRKTFDCGGYYRVWGGLTGSSDGLFGGDAQVPLSECFALQTNFNYLIPKEDNGAAASEEAWGLGISLVWYPGQTARCGSLTQPLFNVADNASFLVERRQP